MSRHHDMRFGDFQAETPHGPLRFSVPVNSPFDDVDMVLALQACEPLLQELEAWLGCALDPSPVHGCMPEAAGLWLTANAGTPEGAWVRCRLPWPLLLDASREVPAFVRAMDWPMLHCEVQVASYAVHPAGRSPLRAGAVLLLPQSFDADWVVRATERQGGLSFECRFNAAAACLRPSGGPRFVSRVSQADGNPTEWRVMLKETMQVRADLALGLRDEPQAMRSTVGAPSSMEAKLLAPGEAAAFASGVIVPVLRGGALLIEDVKTVSPLACLAEAA